MDRPKDEAFDQGVSLASMLRDARTSSSTKSFELAKPAVKSEIDGALDTPLPANGHSKVDTSNQGGSLLDILKGSHTHASDLAQIANPAITTSENKADLLADDAPLLDFSQTVPLRSLTNRKFVNDPIQSKSLSSLAKLLNLPSSTSKNPQSIISAMKATLPPLEPSSAQKTQIMEHKNYLGDFNKDNQSKNEEEAKMAPIFTGPVMIRVPQLFNQYALLGGYRPGVLSSAQQLYDSNLGLDEDPRVLLNVGAPWSAFICGQQGSGKSHTLSCILENCLLNSPVSHLAKPLSSIVFHWDRYTGYSSQQICEAAYLASAGVQVRVLVSPSNLNRMREAYENIPELQNCPTKPIVMPLLFRDQQLNVKRMLTMMGVHIDEDAPPLYVEVILRILRDMAQDNQEKNRVGLNYEEFRSRLSMEQFTGAQTGPMKLRLDLLESFLRTTSNAQPSQQLQAQRQFYPPQQPSFQRGRFDRRNPIANNKPLKTLSNLDSNLLHDVWKFNAGTLTIVDLSCPFVDENAACALFSICLELFLEDRSSVGRIIALDEAHKFLNGSTGALAFTEELLQIIRQQRHLGTRIVIATQEPTISPKLLELCNFTIVHRFQSPSWFKALQGHLAGAFSNSSDEDNELGILSPKKTAADLFEQIVNLQCGEALLFAPSAIIGFVLNSNGTHISPVKLGMKPFRMGTRHRLTADGGRSIMAE